jgi:serine/threonine protein kinase
MTPERWERIQELLLGSLEISDHQRGGFLSEACDGDEALRQEVESLLEAHSTSGPVDRLANTLGARVLTDFIEGGGLEGETAGRYEIRERLGRGGMSVVYRAWDPKLEREVALKFLPALLSLDGASRERLLVEAQVAAGLEHPNICTIYEIGEAEDGRLFISMPLYEGETLQTKLESGPLTEEETLRLALQAARGLAKAHERGVIHRDIKPGNLMITQDGTLKILDFGIAQLEGASERMGQTPGTTYYMSPEQVAGQHVDTRTDLWSLGVVLYEMLTGHRPLEGETREAVRRAIVQDDVAPVEGMRPDLSSRLSALVRSLLQKQPELRPSTAARLVEDLRSLRQAERATPSRRVALVAGLAGVALLSSAIWSWRDGSSSRREAAVGLAEQSVAVLPFQNLTGDASNRELAAGLHMVLVTQLSKMEGLTPISSSSLMEYEKTTKSLGEIAGELDVEIVLEGSVQRFGDQMRVSAQLVDATTGRNLWAELYERELTTDSLFSIQGDIALRIADAMSVELTADQERRVGTPPTQDADAYEYYLRGNALLTGPPAGRESGEVERLSESMFRNAVRLDSTFALAWVALAVINSEAVTGERVLTGTINPRASRRGRLIADSALRKALEYGPDLAETMAAQGWYASNAEGDREKALDHFEAALQVRPNDPEVLGAIGLIRISQGLWDEGLPYLERALRLDPRSYWRASLLGQMYAHLREYDDAERLFDRALETAPTYADGYIGKAIVYLKRNGDVRGARQILEEASGVVDQGEIIYRMVQPLAHSPYVRMLDGFFQAGLADSSVASHVRDRCQLCYWILRGDLADRRGDLDVARVYYDSSMNGMRELQPGDNRASRHRAHVALSLGRREEATRLVELAAPYKPLSEAISHYHIVESLAEVQVRIGDLGDAVETLELLLSHPGLLSVKILELDPLWDPLRERADFRTLLNEYR